MFIFFATTTPTVTNTVQPEQFRHHSCSLSLSSVQMCQTNNGEVSNTHCGMHDDDDCVKRKERAHEIATKNLRHPHDSATQNIHLMRVRNVE